MRNIRQLHLYVGTLFAPAIIFFAFSGALQTLSLHEAVAGRSPPAWIKVMASIHKDQGLSEGHHHADEGDAPGAGHDDAGHDDADHADASPVSAPTDANRVATGKAKAKAGKWAVHLPLKLFVVVMALGLTTSALLGVYIALKNRTTRRITLIMLAIGILLPVVLLFI